MGEGLELERAGGFSSSEEEDNEYVPPSNKYSRRRRLEKLEEENSDGDQEFIRLPQKRRKYDDRKYKKQKNLTSIRTAFVESKGHYIAKCGKSFTTYRGFKQHTRKGYVCRSKPSCEEEAKKK